MNQRFTSSIAIAAALGVAALSAFVLIERARPAPTSPPSTEVEALQREVAALRVALATAASASPAHALAAATANGQPPPSAEPAAEREADPDSDKVSADDLERFRPPPPSPSVTARFSKETRDAAWAPAAEARLQRFFSSMYGDAVVDSVKCLRNTCEVAFATADPQGLLGVLELATEKLGALDGAAGPRYDRKVEDGRRAYVAYLEMRGD